MRHLLKQTIA